MHDKQTEMDLDLWKYFIDDAAKIKDRMWTIASWMFSLQAGLIAFIANHLSANRINDLVVNNPVLVIISAAIGILLCVFTMFMIQQYGQHIRGMWNRADIIRRQLPELTQIWFLSDEAQVKSDMETDVVDTSLPKVAWRLIYLCLGFMGVFLLLLIISIVIGI